jgi:hypothetical protein
MANHADHPLKDIWDSAAIATGLAVFFQWLPAVAGLLSILYTVWRLVESLDNRKRQKLFPYGPFGGSPEEPKSDTTGD